jgi:hypothetical protein
MTQKEIREVYKGLPHIKKVWVLNNEIYIHEVKNAVCVDLDETTNENETTFDDKVVKQRKKK